MFSSENETLPTPLIRDFIRETPVEAVQDDVIQLEDEADLEDEFVEYVPCFQLPTEDFHAVVYWKADLLAYNYVLLTFDKNGVRIAERIIGGMRAEGQTIFQSVTQIDEDYFITIAEGAAKYESNDVTDFDAEDGRVRRLELCNDGRILAM